MEILKTIGKVLAAGAGAAVIIAVANRFDVTRKLMGTDRPAPASK